jgi:chitin synthase
MLLTKNWTLRPPLNSIIRVDRRTYRADMSQYLSATLHNKNAARCLVEVAKVGVLDTASVGCISSTIVLYLSLSFIFSIVIIKFLFALYFEWFLSWKTGNVADESWNRKVLRKRENHEKRRLQRCNSTVSGPYSSSSADFNPFEALHSGNSIPYMSSVRTRAKRANTVPSASSEKAASQKQTPNSNLLLISAYLKHLVCLVTIYSEDEPGIRSTLDSIAVTQYPDSDKLILAICDGFVTGSGNSRSTPEIVLSMMESFQRPFEDSNVSSHIVSRVGNQKTQYGQSLLWVL